MHDGTGKASRLLFSLFASNVAQGKKSPVRIRPPLLTDLVATKSKPVASLRSVTVHRWPLCDCGLVALAPRSRGPNRAR